jgi:phosphoribosyl 1,2-cyclic phosphodiesterase
LVLDAGTGIRRLSSLLGGAAFRGTVLLSHLHWDHLQGLPFCSAAEREDSRVALLFPEQDGDERAVDVLARGMSPPHFPVRPDELLGTRTYAELEPGYCQLEGFGITAAEIPHKGGRTFGYRVEYGGSTLAYLPDHCPTLLGPGRDGLGELHPAALALADGADVLIHDAHLRADELAEQAAYGHAAAEYAVELGRRSGAAHVILFHHAPDRTDEQLDQLAARVAHETTPQVSVAAESMVVSL